MRLLLQALMATALATTPAPPSERPKAEALPMAQDLSNRMTVLTRVNGQGPYRFTIDTAAEHSVVSNELAQTLGLEDGDPATLYSILGPLPVSTVKIDALRIGKLAHRVDQAPILPEQALGAPGLIGLDALANENLLFDFASHRVMITPSGSDTLEHDALGHDLGLIRVAAKRRFGELIITDASVNGVKVVAILDTGAEDTLGNLALREKMGKVGPLKDKGAQVIAVTGGALPVELSALPYVRLGELRMIALPIAYGNVATFHRYGLDNTPAILIGMDLLRNFERVAVDFKRREVRFHMNGDQFFGRS